MADNNEKMLREIAFDAMTPKKTDKIKENEIFEFVQDEVEKKEEKKGRKMVKEEVEEVEEVNSSEEVEEEGSLCNSCIMETARHGKESPTSSSRNFLSAHEKVMKFLERQRERERDSGGVEAVVRRSISKYLPLRVCSINNLTNLVPRVSASNQT